MLWLALAFVLPPGQDAQPAEVKAALKKVEALTATSKDRLTAGLYYLSMGDYKAAIPHLSESPEGTIRSAALADQALAGGGLKDPKALIAAGDLWLEATKKGHKLAASMKDRATYLYGEAWVRQTPDERASLRKLFMAVSPPPSNYQKLLAGQPAGWHPFGGAWKTSVDGGIAHGGRSSAKLLPTKDPAANGFSAVQSLPVQAVEGREYAMTCFVYSFDTDAGGEVELRFFDAQGKGVRGHTAAILSDSPFWRRLEARAQAPAGAVAVAVDCHVKFTRGAVWIDDISLTVDGREVLQNGSFEQK